MLNPSASGSTEGSDPEPCLENFEILIDTYESPLLRYAGRILGFNSLETEDVVQEAFVKLHAALQDQQGDKISSAKSWLYRVVHNLAIDIQRKRKRDHEHHDVIAADKGADAIDQSLLEHMVRREAGQRALQELKALHEEEQQVILLKTIQDLKLREISEVTGLSMGKVAYRLSQGLAALAARLKEGGLL